jgi:hypothetical protein
VGTPALKDPLKGERFIKADRRGKQGKPGRPGGQANFTMDRPGPAGYIR